MKKIIFVLLSGVLILSACALKKMKAFSECEFKLKSVEKLSVANIYIDPKGNKKISFAEALTIAASLSQKKVPITLDLKIDGKNANDVNAQLSRFDWKIKLKDKLALEGTANNSILIPANSTQSFDFGTTFDLFPIISNYDLNQLKELLNNAFDAEGNPKDIKFYMKPYINVGGVNIPYLGYIEVSRYYKSK